MINALIHCRLDIIRVGIEMHLNKLSIPVKISYLDLNAPGILRKFHSFGYDLIFIVLNESDEDFFLCLKVKTFIPNIPVIFISPEIPETYYDYLKKIGVEVILPLPLSTSILDKEVMQALEMTV